MPQKWGFSLICDPKIFFQNSGTVTFVPYGALTSCKILEKSLERFPRYSKTNGRTRAITKDPSDKPVFQNGDYRCFENQQCVSSWCLRFVQTDQKGYLGISEINIRKHIDKWKKINDLTDYVD